MSVDYSNSVPTLKSLVDRADELMKSPPVESSRFPVLAAFFDEAAMVKCTFLAYYPSSAHITDGLEVLLVISPVLGASKSIPGSPKSPDGGSTTVTLQADAFVNQDQSASLSPRSASSASSVDWIAIRACTPCVKAGTECIFAGLATECIACHKGILRNCAGSIPDRQILLMPFDDLHPEEDEHVLSLIEDMINFDPFSIKTPEGFPQDQHTKGIVNNAKAYVGANAQQFPFHSVKSIAALVKVQDSYYNHLQANTRELYLLLKVCHVIVQQVHFIMAKLENLHEEEDAEANTAAKTALASQPTSSSSHHVPWWWVRKERQARRKNHGPKGKGKAPAAPALKCCLGWGCDHINCDVGYCACSGWGCNCVDCQANKGSWGDEDSNPTQYQDGIAGNYGPIWQKKARSGCRNGRY
ncbi:hypothetical protein IW261DRAFT_1413940 [Armillaria novae-zelandiae]|uniref:Uncharacterized protein n=1 Tax=Armillaria novae-zelandiae TaxID=153914 RepID=A0AA39PWG0_9AGAR|nr:hypothetical protein IW261DRAFT_1413940 [Armillaria novae-zelandiae]